MSDNFGMVPPASGPESIKQIWDDELDSTQRYEPIVIEVEPPKPQAEQVRLSPYAGMTRIPESIRGFVPEEYVITINGIELVDDMLVGVLEEAEQERELFERDYAPEDVSNADKELLFYLGDEVWQDDNNSWVNYASRKAVREAKERLERDRETLLTAENDHESHIASKRLEAEGTVLDMLDRFGNFSLIKELLDDPIYQHPAAEILNSAYRGALAICLETAISGNDEEASGRLVQKFVLDNLELIDRTRQDDKQTLQLSGFDPEEFYIDKTDEQMRLHRNVVGYYVHFLLTHAQRKFSIDEFEQLRAAAETPDLSARQNGIFARLHRKIVEKSGVEVVVEQTPAEVLQSKLDKIMNTQSHQDEAMARANQRLQDLLSEKSALLSSEGMTTPIDINNPENNPLLWVTDKVQAYNNLMDFSEVTQNFRGFDVAGDGVTINGNLLKGFADMVRTDDIDRLSARMGDTKGPIGRKMIKIDKSQASSELVRFEDGAELDLGQYSQSEEEAVAYVGIVRRNQGDRPLNGAFLVEAWPHAYKPIFSQGPEDPDKAVRLITYHLTDAMAALVSADYISFYAPGGRAAHGNLDAKMFDDLYRYTQRGIKPGVDTFREGISKSRDESVRAYVIPKFVTPAGELPVPHHNRGQINQTTGSQEIPRTPNTTDFLDI